MDENKIIDSLDSFVSYVKENISEYLPELNIADVTVNEVLKQGDVLLKALVIREEDISVTPSIYLNRYFEAFLDGAEMSDLMRDIANMHLENRGEVSIDLDMISDFDSAKENIRAQLINPSLNKELLGKRPSVKVGVFSAIFRVVIDDNMSVPISNDLMNNYGTTPEELLSIAKDNELAHVTITPMAELIADMMGVEPYEVGDIMFGSEDGPGMTVLSNEEKTFGAAALLNETVLENLSEQMGGDFYILPSSTHETIILPINTMGAYEATNMVREVNATEVAVSDQLGDEAYVYDHKRREIVSAIGYERDKERVAEKGSLIGALTSKNEEARGTEGKAKKREEIAI